MSNTNERRSDFPFEFSYNDYYTTRYEVCETETNEKLEEFKSRLSDAVDYAKQHLDKKPYIIEVRYYVEAESKNGVVDEEDIVWKYDEAEDVDLCGHCGRVFNKTELLYNYKGRKLPVCNWCKDKELFQDVDKPEWAKRSFQPGASGYSNTMTEAFEEKTIYVVHSDTDENNILQDFDDLSAALEYAKDNIDELTYVEEVVMNPESEEIYSTEIIWSYDEDDAEDQVVCEWCHDLVYETECRRELNLGLICRNCQSALYSRGEKPVFEEAYNSDYAEGEDIFDQEFPEANSESKYSLEESSEPKWNLGSNKLVDRDSVEYQYLEELAARLQEERPYNEDGDYVFYEVARTYEDYGAGMEWYTIIVNDPKSVAGSYQLLYPSQWLRLANTGDVEGVLKDILKGSQLTELFDVDLNVGIDGGENNDVSVLSSYEPEKGEDKLDEIFDVNLNATLDGGSGNNVSVLSPLGGLGEDLKEGLNNSEFAEYMQLCKEIGIKGNKDLLAFMEEVGLEVGCDPHLLLDALREYRAELGPDFKIIHEEVEEDLTEGYKIDLPQIRVRDIKRELDLHRDITFNLPEPMDFTDESGWWGANDVVVMEKDNGEYECYYQWLDQDGDLLEPDSEADGYFENFEELLYWLNDYIVNIVDLDEYIGSEIVEGLKETREPEEETELRTQDPSAEPDDQAVDTEQVIEVDSEVLEESQAQEISSEYRRLSKEYGIDFEDLVYGEKGFMKTKYPEGFPDFAGDVIYSEKYWNELIEFAKEKGIDLKSNSEKEELVESTLVKGTFKISESEVLEWGWDKSIGYYVEKLFKPSQESDLWQSEFKNTYATSLEALKAFENYKQKISK